MKTEIKHSGLGLRREMLSPAPDPALFDQPISFLEIAPENWVNIGGSYRRRFNQVADKVPMVLHGLSLSLGGPDALDVDLVHKVKEFKQAYQIPLYSEHLSFCSDNAHLYDLLPIPFTEAAARHVSDRIGATQDILGERIAIENSSYYLAPGAEMSEIEFIKLVLDGADCNLMLDLNNVYVNSVNHRYDAKTFLEQLPGQRIVYGHVAGHYNEADDLIVDTHGADVITNVWDLLRHAYRLFGVFPTLLERDFNIPPMTELLKEVSIIRDCQEQAIAAAARAV